MIQVNKCLLVLAPLIVLDWNKRETLRRTCPELENDLLLSALPFSPPSPARLQGDQQALKSILVFYHLCSVPPGDPVHGGQALAHLWQQEEVALTQGLTSGAM